MRKIHLATCVAIMLCCLAKLNAQNYNLELQIKDQKTGEFIPGVSAILLNTDSVFITGSNSDIEGRVKLNAASGRYILKLNFLGYENYSRPIFLSENKNLGIISLKTSSKQLKELEVEGTQVRAEQKGDTVQYNADAFKTNPDATLEDLVKKMPGITVENGQAKVGGETVQKVLIDGKEFFGDDASMALKNLPAEVVEKIEVFDRLSDQAQFTGFDDGNARKAINVVTRGRGLKDASFGKFYAGAGTENRFNAGLNYNRFKGNRRITILGQSNNINQQNFSSQDLVGLTGGSSGGGMGGMGGGGGRGGMMRMMGMVPGANDPSNFMVSQSNGINTTHSFGINYTDSLSKRLKLQASYFFNNTFNETDKQTARNFFLNDSTSQRYEESNSSWSNNLNHRLNLRFEYTIDSLNSIIYTPRISWQGNQNAARLDGNTQINSDSLLSNTQTRNSSFNTPYTVNNNILYRHKFKKQGRTVSVALNLDWSERPGGSQLSTINQFFQPDSTLEFSQRGDNYANSQTYSANVMYTEPLGKALQLFVNYSPSYTFNFSDRTTNRKDPDSGEFNRLDSLLSNRFDNLQSTQRGGIGLRLRSMKLMGVLTVNAQEFTLQNNQFFPSTFELQRRFRNILPFAMLNYKFSRATNIRIFYRTNTNAPTVSQLQAVPDNSNPLQLSTGNPDLNQELSQSLTVRFGTTSTESGRSLFFNGSASFTNDYIGNSSLVATSDTMVYGGIRLRPGAQLSRPVNLDGYQTYRSLLTYSMPLKWIKSTLNIQGGGNYLRTPGMINGRMNETSTANYTAGAVLASNINPKIDFTLSYTGGWNAVTNTLQPQLNNNYQIHSGNAKINWIPVKWLVINSDFTYNQFLGLGSGFDQQFLLWNAYVGLRFLKNQSGELKFSAFDILNQNNSINRTVTETYIEDVRTRVLNRYFMLTFTYTLRKFPTLNTENKEGRFPEGPPMPGIPPR